MRLIVERKRILIGAALALVCSVSCGDEPSASTAQELIVFDDPWLPPGLQAEPSAVLVQALEKANKEPADTPGCSTEADRGEEGLDSENTVDVTPNARCNRDRPNYEIQPLTNDEFIED